MKLKISQILPIAFIIVFAIACAFTGSPMSATGTLWALLPPVIAIGLALVTKEVYSSLFIGIVVGGLLATGFNPVHTVDTIVTEGLISAVSGTAGIFLFLVELGILVALVNKAGGSAAFGKWAQKHIKTRVGAMLATFALGVLIFIDDYFNCLTVGSVMRPVTDGHKISRAKLAFLIDATAAPVCMIAPISSWAAAVSSTASDLGINGLKLFIEAIPYNYYSLLTFIFIVAISLTQIDFGAMAIHEKNAKENGDLFTTGAFKGEEVKIEETKGKVIDLVLPIVVLIATCIFSLIYVGRSIGDEGFASANYDPSISFIDAFANTDATVGLPWGGLVALVIAIIYLVARRVISFKDAMDCIPKGFNAMVPAILILTFATALKNMTGLLEASTFVASVMEGAAAGLASLLPAVIFIVACLLAFATGTSWGTFGILIPIVVAIFPVESPLLIIGISACLAGAVCGDHCSPISDTTIMSSAGAQCDHINHVQTQIPYAVLIAAVSFVSYILAGFIQNAVINLIIGIVLMLAAVFAVKAITEKKAAPKKAEK